MLEIIIKSCAVLGLSYIVYKNTQDETKYHGNNKKVKIMHMGLYLAAVIYTVLIPMRLS